MGKFLERTSLGTLKKLVECRSAGAQGGQERMLNSLGAGVKGGCELPYVGAGNQI